MGSVEETINDIRQRVIDQERGELMRKAEKKFPNDVGRQEKYVYKALAAKYEFKRNDILELPLDGLEISFAIGANSFGEGECLADIMKRDVGDFIR